MYGLVAIAEAVNNVAHGWHVEMLANPAKTLGVVGHLG
jgi:hypothetical protein